MSEKKSGGFLERFAAFVVDKRNVIFTLYVFALIFSVIAMSWVEVESDVTKYLAEGTETRLGMDAMNANFEMVGTARMMVSNVTYDTALEIYDYLSEADQVQMAEFDDTSDHYKDACALYDLTFCGEQNAPETIAAMAAIESELGAYDLYVDTQIGYDDNAMLREEMLVIGVVAAIFVLIGLLFTSRAYMEVPVMLLSFGAAAVMNMGTNFIFGRISFISDSVAVVLQLALALDYAVMLCHRFSEAHKTRDARDAAIYSLTKAIPEIGGSCLTTMGGLLALGFMQFGIGKDLSMVLIKSILLSLVAVFTLMPGLLVVLCPLMDKTTHRKLVPDIDWVGRFAVRFRKVVPPCSSAF